MSGKVKVRQQARGKIDVSRFSTKRKLDVDLGDLTTLMNDCKPREAKFDKPAICTVPPATPVAPSLPSGPPVAKVKDDGTGATAPEASVSSPLQVPPTAIVKDDGTLPTASAMFAQNERDGMRAVANGAEQPKLPLPTETPTFFDGLIASQRKLVGLPSSTEEKPDLTQPIKGDDGELIWPPEAIVPEPIQAIYDQVRAIYNIKDEVSRFACMVWAPREVVKGKKVKVHTIPKAPMGIATRVVLTLGGKEHYFMAAGMGSASGDGALTCFPGESFMIPIGVAAAIDFSFDDSTSFLAEGKKGFRTARSHKDPSRCYVIVVDGVVNTERLVRQIKLEADKLSNGNAAVSAKLQAKVGAALDVTPEGRVAAIAAASDAKEPEEAPTLVPMDKGSDIDAVAAMAGRESVMAELDAMKPVTQPGIVAAESTEPPITGATLNTFHNTEGRSPTLVVDGKQTDFVPQDSGLKSSHTMTLGEIKEIAVPKLTRTQTKNRKRRAKEKGVPAGYKGNFASMVSSGAKGVQASYEATNGIVGKQYTTLPPGGAPKIGPFIKPGDTVIGKVTVHPPTGLPLPEESLVNPPYEPTCTFTPLRGEKKGQPCGRAATNADAPMHRRRCAVCLHKPAEPRCRFIFSRGEAKGKACGLTAVNPEVEKPLLRCVQCISKGLCPVNPDAEFHQHRPQRTSDEIKAVVEHFAPLAETEAAWEAFEAKRSPAKYAQMGTIAKVVPAEACPEVRVDMPREDHLTRSILDMRHRMGPRLVQAPLLSSLIDRNETPPGQACGLTMNLATDAPYNADFDGDEVNQQAKIRIPAALVGDPHISDFDGEPKGAYSDAELLALMSRAT